MIKFSEDLVPFNRLKANPDRVIRHAVKTHRPAVVTKRGRQMAVVQSVDDYKKSAEEKDFMQAVVDGLLNIERDPVYTLEEAKKRLGLNEST